MELFSNMFPFIIRIKFTINSNFTPCYKMSQSRDSLFHAIEQTLSYPRNPEILERVLATHGNRNEAKEVVRNEWAQNESFRHTWLTRAVSALDFEIIAILMSYGADPFKVCTGRQDLCAFDDIISHYHARHRPQFHFLATLLNVGVPSSRGYMIRDDHLFGRDPNAFLPTLVGEDEVVLPDADTPLTFAVKNNLPYCIRWLIYGRRANVNVPNVCGITPLETTLQCFPKRPLPNDTNINHEIWDKNFAKWNHIVLVLYQGGGGSTLYTFFYLWEHKYPEAFRCLLTALELRISN